MEDRQEKYFLVSSISNYVLSGRISGGKELELGIGDNIIIHRAHYSLEEEAGAKSLSLALRV